MVRKLIMMAMVACSVLAVNTPAYAGSEQKRAEIREMMEVSGGLAIADQMMRLTSEQFIAAMSQQTGERPPAGIVIAVQDATSRVMRRNFGTYLDSLIDVYDKLYTDEEVTAILAFYKSPAGRKSVQTLPQVMQASQALAQRWGASIQNELQAEIVAEIEKVQRKTGG